MELLANVLTSSEPNGFAAFPSHLPILVIAGGMAVLLLFLFLRK